MTSEDGGRPGNEQWAQVLLGTHPSLRRMRRIFRHLPTDPRCKLCLSPFGGPAGRLLPIAGFGRYPRNPQLCNNCFRSAKAHPGGAEIEISVLFADVRGSTSMAEGMSAGAFSGLIKSYYTVATRAIREPGGIIDKLLGDGVMALFIPGFTGNHADKAIGAARTILAEVQLPVGAAVHTGKAWVGFIGGSDEIQEFTALGDAVNTASRLASEAASGELLLSDASARAAGIDTAGLTSRRLELRGREEPVDAWSERIAPTASPVGGALSG